jgi:hypothetical protein
MADFPGAIAKLTAGPPGLVTPIAPLRPVLTHDPVLQAALVDALADVRTAMNDPSINPPFPEKLKTLKPFGFAVVDLTDDPAVPGFDHSKPAYAGSNDTTQFTIASLAKLLPLYAAHKIRADAHSIYALNNPASITQLATMVRAHYQRIGAADDTFPLVENMLSIQNGVVDFRVGGTWPGFAGTGLGLPLDLKLKELNTADHGNTPPTERGPALAGKLDQETPVATKVAALRAQLDLVEFREQLRLMAGWSNNVSSSIVTQAIGFPFLWQLSNRSGLFRTTGWMQFTGPKKGRTTDPGGLFLGQDYQGNAWLDRPAKAPVFGEAPSQAGNARSVAQLMAALAHELINVPARVSMREMLRKGDRFGPPLGTRGEDSPIGGGMFTWPARPWQPTQLFWNFDAIPAAGTPAHTALVEGDLSVSKIGLLPAGDIIAASNALLIRTKRGTAAKPVTICAVLVVLGATSDVRKEHVALVSAFFGAAMGNKLDARHP